MEFRSELKFDMDGSVVWTEVFLIWTELYCGVLKIVLRAELWPGISCSLDRIVI